MGHPEPLKIVTINKVSQITENVEYDDVIQLFPLLLDRRSPCMPTGSTRPDLTLSMLRLLSCDAQESKYF